MRVQAAGADGFKQALGSFTSGVTVITVHDRAGAPTGMTASAFSSVSVEPPLILVCINRQNRTYQDLTGVGRFGVNILSAEARDVSDHCARSGSDKTLPAAWLAADGGRSPALRGALAYLDCTVHEEIEGGTHAVILGRVERIGLADGPEDPLVYYRGSYRELREHAAMSA